MRVATGVMMPFEQLPITPALITWARSRAGLSLEAASKDFKKIQEWEHGTSSPTYPQLEKLSDALKVPIAVFFFPEPPNVPDIGETFRTLPDAEFEQIPSRVRLLLRKGKALQLNLMELTGGQNPARRLITKDLTFATNANLGEMAASVREYLGVTLDTQRAWPDDDTALKAWREALFGAGIFVFKDAFKIDEFSGFCLFDDVFPIIYANNSSSKTRQIFTLFHELAHLLFHTSGIDTIHDEYISHLADDAQRIEILCNRFAAEFLLPQQAFAAAIRGQPATEGTAERLAAAFHVSREVVFRKFLDQGSIDQRTYNQAVALWTSQRSGGGSGGDYYWTKLAYLGRDYVALAISQYQQNRIDERKLADFLDTKPRNLAVLDGPSAELRAWAENNDGLFSTPTAVEGAFVAKIYGVQHFHQNLEQQKLLRGGRNADPFIIARAAAEARTVVTMEVFKANAAKIPNICRHFGIGCMTLEEFMEAEGWQF